MDVYIIRNVYVYLKYKMTSIAVNKKKIAKNTMFLYFRMILIMGVSLYSSRVVLESLGVTDYGLYNVVGGVVGMLSFLNGTLSIGTSRFITYELGTQNEERLKTTFSTAFFTHVALAIVIILIMETLGMWFINNKLVVPHDRLSACIWVFHLSVITTFISITQVPYTSCIMAHEHMNIYAYVSIFEAFAKLGICYLVLYSSKDKLVFYAILIAAVHFIVASLYRLYCINKFKESKLRAVFNKKILCKLLGFSGWNVMANLTETLKNQGVLILINMFFAPFVAAAQAIANQVSNAMLQFVNNFRTAINPQIIKLYASGNKESSKKLTLETTVYCYDLILLLGLPAIVIMDKIMNIWLVEVPDYAVSFTIWIIIRNIVNTFNASFYIPMMAANKMKSNSIAAVILGVTEFLILYFLLKIGLEPMWVQYLGVLFAAVLSFLVKPYILHKEIDYSIKELSSCFIVCLKVTIISLLISLPIAYLIEDSIIGTFLKCLICVLGVIIASYISLNKQIKQKIRIAIMSKFLKR